eukprot:TRINITY_DN5471_c0_g2_i1.p1 TRINITY_DN5471_c0_g2~~TRINITY_DN5471_c0_g2_i1.p1  ORF type:complete len:408 (+),score=57.52 TRINITY_DN5471_c0_g2_i1:1108-2331(+)
MDRSNADLAKEPLLNSAELGEDDEGCGRVKLHSFKEEIKKQLQIAVPMIAMNLLQFALQVISLMIVGHLGELSLSGASLATSFANATGFSFLLGLASGLETLCGQAYGAKQYRLVGILLQRAIFTLLCVSTPLSIIWVYMKHILLAVGQDPSISSVAEEYARWLIPSLFAYAFLQPLMKFLQSQSIIMPMMLSAVLALLVHIPLCWFLVLKAGLGIKGAALALDIAYWFNVTLLLLYIIFFPACAKTRTMISKDALHDIKDFLKVAIPSAVMICFEWWSFEILVLLSGLLPNPELETSALSICHTTSSLAYMIPYGFGAAASTRVSNELGGGNIKGALLAVQAVICIAGTETLIRGIIIFSLRNIWGHAFSKEEDVIQYTATLMPILALSSMLDGIQGVLSGTQNHT